MLLLICFFIFVWPVLGMALSSAHKCSLQKYLESTKKNSTKKLQAWLDKIPVEQLGQFVFYLPNGQLPVNCANSRDKLLLLKNHGATLNPTGNHISIDDHPLVQAALSNNLGKFGDLFFYGSKVTDNIAFHILFNYFSDCNSYSPTRFKIISICVCYLSKTKFFNMVHARLTPLGLLFLSSAPPNCSLHYKMCSECFPLLVQHGADPFRIIPRSGQSPIEMAIKLYGNPEFYDRKILSFVEPIIMSMDPFYMVNGQSILEYLLERIKMPALQEGCIELFKESFHVQVTKMMLIRGKMEGLLLQDLFYSLIAPNFIGLLKEENSKRQHK